MSARKGSYVLIEETDELMNWKILGTFLVGHECPP